MKTILTILLFIVVSNLKASNDDSLSTKDEYRMIETRNINLMLPKYKQSNTDDRKLTFAVLLVGGLAFTAASILEGNGNYGTWSHTPNSTSQYNMTYSTKPFIQQTRVIMFGVGVGLSLTGVIGLLSK